MLKVPHSIWYLSIIRKFLGYSKTFIQDLTEPCDMIMQGLVIMKKPSYGHGLVKLLSQMNYSQTYGK